MTRGGSSRTSQLLKWCYSPAEITGRVAGRQGRRAETADALLWLGGLALGVGVKADMSKCYSLPLQLGLLQGHWPIRRSAVFCSLHDCFPKSCVPDGLAGEMAEPTGGAASRWLQQLVVALPVSEYARKGAEPWSPSPPRGSA